MQAKTERPRRILVVDDNLDTAQSLVFLLGEMGHTAEFALDGRSALRAARRTRPEIVFLDLGLPDIDGFAVARQLRREPALEGARIVAVTGREWDEGRSREAGCDEHLVKPLNITQLESLLEPSRK